MSRNKKGYRITKLKKDNAERRRPERERKIAEAKARQEKANTTSEAK